MAISFYYLFKYIYFLYIYIRRYKLTKSEMIKNLYNEQPSMEDQLD